MCYDLHSNVRIPPHALQCVRPTACVPLGTFHDMARNACVRLRALHVRSNECIRRHAFHNLGWSWCDQRLYVPQTRVPRCVRSTKLLSNARVPLHMFQCTRSIARSLVHAIQCTRYNAREALKSTRYNARAPVYDLQSTRYNARAPVYNLQCTRYNVSLLQCNYVISL